MPLTPRPVFRSRCTGRRTTCKAPLCRRRSRVSTLMLKYAAAASRSSKRGPGATKAAGTAGRRDADKTRGADGAATGSLLRERAPSGRSWPAFSGPPSVPTSSLIGSPMSSSADIPVPWRLASAGQFLSPDLAEADLIPLPGPPDTATLAVSGRSRSAPTAERSPPSPARARHKPATRSRARDSVRPCQRWVAAAQSCGVHR